MKLIKEIDRRFTQMAKKLHWKLYLLGFIAGWFSFGIVDFIFKGIRYEHPILYFLNYFVFGSLVGAIFIFKIGYWIFIESKSNKKKEFDGSDWT